MKLLLTSTGLSNKNIKDKFLFLFFGNLSGAKVLFVVSAAEEPREKWYVNKSREELLALGINERNLVTYHQGEKPSKEILDSISLIYVCGGNTFRLLNKIKESGLDKDIVEMIKKGVFYIGASAGSIIVTPNIEIAEPWDSNEQELKDLAALSLVNFTVSPHYTEDEEGKVDEIEKRLGIEIKRITDKQAVLVVDNKVEIIG